VSTFNRTLVAWLAVVMLLLAPLGCKKSVEGEQEAWKSNVAQVKALIATYPGFQPALDQRLTKATELHDAADALDGDAKIDKLSEANSALMAGWVRDMQGLEEAMKDLRTKRVEAAAHAGDESSRLGAKVAAEDAQKALDRAQKSLESGAKDEASATAVVKAIESDIQTAAKAVESVLKADKSKKDDKAAKDEAKEVKEAAAKADADAKVAPWKCEYCGAENPHDETSCKSCGAPKAEAKK
jgi:predicted Zn-ribbon and HTH transcriptional regulator